MKRVVAGVRNGVGTILADEPPVNVRPMDAGDGTVAEIWSLAARDLDTTDRTPTSPPGMDLSPDEGRFRIVVFPAPATDEAAPGRMHRTDTIDLGVVLAGRIDVVMEDGSEARLEAGDCLVQLGANHAWRNPGPGDCTLAMVVLGADEASCHTDGQS